jgi:sigma-B regulation protein RsbU (phosphoserine phosphatase)
MSLRLRVEPPGAQPFERDLEGAELIIGRASTAGLVLADSSASRQHVRLFQREGQWWIEDLGTRNGTWLNEQPLTVPASLQAGDRIRVGETVVRLGPSERRDRGPSDLRPLDESGRPAEESEADRQTGRLRTLNEIHRALATPISLSSLLDLILERCFEVLHPEEGLILLRGKDGELRPAATRRRPGSSGEILVSRRIIDEVAGKGIPALVIDAAIDERFSGSESIMMSGVKSVVAAPLTDAEGTIGLIALCSRASVRQFAPPDLDMLVSLASAAALRVRNVALAEEAAARRVLEHELSLAHDMQMAMLPRRLPERPEVELAASLEPAHSVGGDLYDFVLDGDQLWFIVADVSGKGVAAALYMAVAKTLFRAMVQTRVEVGEVLARMNRELCRDNDQMMFVTAVVGHLRLATGEVVLSDSGHNPVVLLRRNGSLTKVELPKGVALGVVDDFVFAQSTFVLEPHEALVFYTDGATDACNPAGDLFGAARLDQAIASVATAPVDAIVGAIVRTVNDFAGNAPPVDDLTVLALRYRGAS